MSSTTAVPTAAATPAGTARRRHIWALWGSAAGLGGLLTNIVFAQPLSEQVRSSGDATAVVAELSRGNYHVSAITGFLTVACLLLFAAGLHRWTQEQSSDSLALRAAPLGILASAAALIAGYGVKGQLSAYLEGGFNESSYEDGARYLYFVLDDLAGYYSWWGVAVAAACIAWLSFRERLIVRWVGAAALVACAVPLLFLGAFGFTGISGIVCPIFLVLAGIGLSRQRA